MDDAGQPSDEWNSMKLDKTGGGWDASTDPGDFIVMQIIPNDIHNPNETPYAHFYIRLSMSVAHGLDTDDIHHVDMNYSSNWAYIP